MDQRLIGRKRGAALSFRTFALPALTVASLALNIYLLFVRLPAIENGGSKGLDESAVSHTSESGSIEAGEGIDVSKAAVPPVHEKNTAPTDSPDVAYEGLTLSVKGSIARTFSQAMGSEKGDVVSAFYSRIFMWKLDLKSDVRAGDQLRLRYRLMDNGQVDIQAASYRSGKHHKTYLAYKFQQKGQDYPHFYDETGKEIAERLINSPLKVYEQVTSLLKDRPTHKGIDFKAPVGTAVLAPHSAKVTRANWGSFKYNGNCVELSFNNGNIAKFLHLEKLPKGTKPGRRLKAGESFATSGNTGRSTAPHLHYQVENKKGRIIDPFTAEKTTHLQLSASEMVAFSERVNALDIQLNQ